MRELEEGTRGFVLEAGDPKYDCQICSANLEQQGQPPCEANAGVTGYGQTTVLAI
jgi:hypothetical protein